MKRLPKEQELRDIIKGIKGMTVLHGSIQNLEQGKRHIDRLLTAALKEAREDERERCAEGYIAIIKRIEWSSFAQGQGSGFMGSGGDGVMVSVCPECGGINPKDPARGEFTESSYGHGYSCQIADAIRRGGGK